MAKSKKNQSTVPSSQGLPPALSVPGTKIASQKFAQTMTSTGTLQQLKMLKQAKAQGDGTLHTAFFGTGADMGLGGYTGGTDSVVSSEYTNPYNHNFPVDVLERPQSRREQIEWANRFYREHPVVHRVIDLHTQLPLSKATLMKPVSSSQAYSDYIYTFYQDMVRRIDLFSKLRRNIGKAYWLHGDDFVFLEDQKKDIAEDSEAIEIPPEDENPPSPYVTLFDANRYVHGSAFRKWAKKKKALQDQLEKNPMLSLLHNQNLLGKLPPPPARATLDEEEFQEVFSPTALDYLKKLHRVKNGSAALGKFLRFISGERTAATGKIPKDLMRSIGPEFLPMKSAAVYKKALEALSQVTPVNVTNIPRNQRSLKPTPNLDFQRFLRDNPIIRQAVESLPDENALEDAANSEPPEGVRVVEGTPEGHQEGTSQRSMESMDEAPDFDPESLTDDSSEEISDLDEEKTLELQRLYNKNLKRKKELLQNIKEELESHVEDYEAFSRIRYPKYKGWQAMRSLPPFQVEVKRTSNSEDLEILYIPTGDEQKEISQNLEKMDSETQEIWKRQKRLPLSTKTTHDPSNQDAALPADGSYCVQVSNGRSDYDLYGHGLVESCFRDLIHDDKIAQVKSQTFARNMQPKRVVTAEGVDEDTLLSLQDMVDASTVDPDTSIVTNYPISWQEIGIADRLQSFDSEYAHIYTNLSAGLAFFQEFITGQTTYSGSRVPQEIMNTMYLAYREDISDFVEEKIFRPVAERKGFYDFDAFGNKVLIYPKISFARLAIRDAGETFEMMLNLYLKGSLSISRIYEVMDIDEEEEIAKLKAELFTVRDPKMTDLIGQLYQQVADTLIKKTNLPEVLTENLGLIYQEEMNKTDDEENASGEDFTL
jgi:hypothetical protein